ncbi:hypothetical protein NM688_g885 [Phlebia brevispora]|uniref:Uncharacterized protein n=1 Tax=Phlebia brevispora TaxID=194682 RepID=A0ACC1TDD0_9APHY|nr:hypothetical protein NM688_g885 [Phlebia brevispora]
MIANKLKYCLAAETATFPGLRNIDIRQLVSASNVSVLTASYDGAALNAIRASKPIQISALGTYIVQLLYLRHAAGPLIRGVVAPPASVSFVWMTVPGRLATGYPPNIAFMTPISSNLDGHSSTAPMVYRTHLTVLEEVSSLYPSRPVFKVPRLASDGSEQVEQWLSISYPQFKADVEAYAKYWAHALQADGLPVGTVIGTWLGGMTYLDVLHIYGLTRAGYVPQLFSLRLPNPDVVYELLHKAGAKALVYDRSFGDVVSSCPLPTHMALESAIVDVSGYPLPSMPQVASGDDIAMIFHTSGSTSGSPKLVPCNYTWLEAMITKAFHSTVPNNAARQDVTTWLGSVCHIGQNFMFWGSLQHGSCTIQPTKITFSSDELLDMVARCGLNRLNQFATFLVAQLRASRSNPKLLNALRGMDEVLYSGLALPREDEEWAYQNQILLKNLFGNTECGAMLLSIGGKEANARHLRPIESTRYGFFLVSPQSTETAHVDANSQLRELVILAESPDCPHSSLRASDGHYHTGDLFLEVSPGCYVSRGRDDDWIKSQNSLRCDTKAIEDNVRATCGDLISDCIVVGNGRPSPALFVEAKGDIDEATLKKDIIRRTRHFHARRYLHERITSTSLVFVVPKGTLPRTATKGNIRRRAVEEAFRLQLDAVFGSSF